MVHSLYSAERHPEAQSRIKNFTINERFFLDDDDLEVDEDMEEEDEDDDEDEDEDEVNSTRALTLRGQFSECSLSVLCSAVTYAIDYVTYVLMAALS